MDLKSLDFRVVPVRFRPQAPLKLKKKPYRLNRYDASLRRFCFCSPAFSLSHFSFLVHFLSKRLTTSCDSLRTTCASSQHSQGYVVSLRSGPFRGLSLVLRPAPQTPSRGWLTTAVARRRQSGCSALSWRWRWCPTSMPATGSSTVSRVSCAGPICCAMWLRLSRKQDPHDSSPAS